jgi:Uma2 family endonuclease
MQPAPQLKYSIEEYHQLEKNTAMRYEYHFGQVIAMAGSSKAHNRIVRNVGVLLDVFLVRGCAAYTENIKLELIRDQLYRYPDAVLTCDERDAIDPYLVRYPSLIVEVLSEGTKAIDLGEKTEEYLSIPSLKAYLILYQDRIAARLMEQEPDGSWVIKHFIGSDTVVHIVALEIEWMLKDIYAHVVFQKDHS